MKKSTKSKKLEKMVRLPDGRHFATVTDAELCTANRIYARWMFEHPEITELVIVRGKKKSETSI